jgi:hypothetical protein
MNRTSRAKSVLRELVGRIADQCEAEGREDLVEGVRLLEALANANPEALRSKRRLMLHLLERDSQLTEFTAVFSEHRQLCEEALIEKLSARVH